MFACAIVVAFCSCEADEQLPTANGGEHIYTMSLDAALNDYDAATTRVGYNWSDGTILYLQFVVGNQTIVGNATYSKEADGWSVTTSEALANVDSARCEAYFFKDSVQSDSSVIPLSESIAVYQDTCGYYVKTDNYLSVSLRLSPKTGRIRFKGESGRKFTIRGMYQLSGYDILENRFDSTKVELSPTVLADGYTPYYYTVFTDTSRTLTVVDGLIEYTKDCSSTILADGKSGYMILPTKDNHTGWNAIKKDTVVAEAINLGLSVMWASHNVGATAPEEFGGYYAWGETEVKDNYDMSTYKWYDGTERTITKYYTENYVVADKDILDLEDDVAHVKWNECWRMPTFYEILELCNNCSREWTTINGVDGYKFTGPNGNSIFLPAAGYRDGTEVIGHGLYGRYWSGSLYLDYGDSGASSLYFNGSHCDWNGITRDYGYTVRPVQNKNTVEEEPIIETIAGVLASGEGKTVKTQGTIVATHAHGILLHDETGYIHVRLDANTDNVVGDVVTVKGYLIPRNGLLEFAEKATIEKVGTAEVVHPEPVVWDGAALDSYLTSPIIQYVQYTGVLSKEDDDYIVTVSDSVTTAVGQITYPASDLVDANDEGREVQVIGYAIGYTDDKYVRTMVTFVRLVIDETAVAEAVDLGLSVKWASWNVGATAPEEYGGYYAWGETEVKDNYDWSTYKWCNGDSYSMTKYCIDSDYGTVDNKTMLDSEDDVAYVKWGGAWRMPTFAEFEELRNNCSLEWTTVNGVNGFTISGNGNSIFLPAAGECLRTEVGGRGSVGYYWSGSLYIYNNVACHIYFDSYLYGSNYFSLGRCRGLTVRPVQDY